MHVRNQITCIPWLIVDLTISLSRPAFPIDRNKSAVVLPKALRFFNSDTMEQAEDTADAIAEFDRALSNQGLSVPKLDGFLPDHAKVPPMDKKVNHHLRSSL